MVLFLRQRVAQGGHHVRELSCPTAHDLELSTATSSDHRAERAPVTSAAKRLPRSMISVAETLFGSLGERVHQQAKLLGKSLRLVTRGLLCHASPHPQIGVRAEGNRKAIITGERCRHHTPSQDSRQRDQS